MPRMNLLAALLALAALAGAAAAQQQDLFDRQWSAVSLPHKRVVLSNKLVERVAEIKVEEGDTVRHGDLLIELDARVLERQIEVAKASADFSTRISSAKVRHDHLAREYDRLTMVAEGVSQSELDRSRTERDLAALDVDELQRQQKVAQLQVLYHQARLNDYRVTSPLEGTAVVSNIWVEVGEMIDEAQRLVELINPTLVEVHVHVPERNLSLLQIVDRVEVSFPSVRQSNALPASIHFISPYVDSASGTCMVKLLVALDENSLIKPGLGCRVRFHDILIAPAPETD